MNNGKVFESHSIFIADRHRSEFTGIDDVLSFDESSVCAHSTLGDIIIDGEELKIDNFSAEKGLLCISGKIIGFSYLENDSKKHSAKKRR